MVKIYTPVGGRLGNQLFYYGFARWMQEKYLEKGIESQLIFDFSNIVRHGENYKYETEGWEDNLQLFHTVDYDRYSKNRVTYREGNPLQIAEALKIKLLNKTNIEKYKEYLTYRGQYLNRIGLVYALPDMPIEQFCFNGKQRKIFLRSVPETSRYINDIREKLLKEITPKEQPMSENNGLYEIIQTRNSVCVSVRRGDYVTNPDVAAKFSSCNKQYFEKALEIMLGRIENPAFIFFSDDIEWCRMEFENYPADVYFESGRDSLGEKLRMMYSCKHFVISNSTFSWWAQWLGRHEDKIVISPNHWYKHAEDHLIERDFIKIAVD